MPRGDLRAQNNKGMPPSHNCVWVESNITEEKKEENWNKVFGSSHENKVLSNGEGCTCNEKEVVIKDKLYITTQDCKWCGKKGEKKEIKVHGRNQGFSPRQRREALKAITTYGKGPNSVQEVMYRK